MMNQLIETLPTIGLIVIALYGSLGLFIFIINLIAKGNDK